MGRQLAERIADLAKKREHLDTEIAKQESYVSSLSERVSLVRENYTDGEMQRIAGDLDRLNAKKSSLERGQTEILAEYHEKSSGMARLEAQETKELAMLHNLEEEEKGIGAEKLELESKIENLKKEKNATNESLVKLREKEQEMIATSGTSVGRLKEYDEKLHELNNNDKSLTKGINGIERATDSLSRDLQDMREKQAVLQKMLSTLEFDGEIDDFDVGPILAGACGGAARHARAERKGAACIH